MVISSRRATIRKAPRSASIKSPAADAPSAENPPVSAKKSASWLPSGRIDHTYACRKHLGAFECHTRQPAERHLSQSWQRGEKRQTGVRDASALVEIDLLQRRHASKQLE